MKFLLKIAFVSFLTLPAGMYMGTLNVGDHEASSPILSVK